MASPHSDQLAGDEEQESDPYMDPYHHYIQQAQTVELEANDFDLEQ